jgi:sensor domain CHASE-containing protein
MLLELMILNALVFAFILVVMLVILIATPIKKHSKRQVKEDLNSIKDQINGDA